MGAGSPLPSTYIRRLPFTSLPYHPAYRQPQRSSASAVLVGGPLSLGLSGPPSPVRARSRSYKALTRCTPSRDTSAASASLALAAFRSTRMTTGSALRVLPDASSRPAWSGTRAFRWYGFSQPGSSGRSRTIHSCHGLRHPAIWPMCRSRASRNPISWVSVGFRT